jgi:hypothetical protein
MLKKSDLDCLDLVPIHNPVGDSDRRKGMWRMVKSVIAHADISDFINSINWKSVWRRSWKNKVESPVLVGVLSVG